jgi:hypothetical protein
MLDSLRERINRLKPNLRDRIRMIRARQQAKVVFQRRIRVRLDDMDLVGCG